MSILGNGLKHRSRNHNDDDVVASIRKHLPTFVRKVKVSSQSISLSSSSSMIPFTFTRCKSLSQFISIFIRVILICICSFITYVGIIHVHNNKSVRDPCMVAEMTKGTIQQSLLSMKRDLTPTTMAAAAKSQFKLKSSNRAREEIATSIIQKALSTTSTAQTLSTTSFEPKVPKIIHQQWKDNNIPDKFMKWRNKWLQLYRKPEYTHMIWTDENGRELIQNHYPWFLDTYDGYNHNINRADAARYFILHHYGGIYADLDYEPQLNFYDYLPSNQVSMVESPYYWNEKTQNCLMSSPRQDPFWIDLFTILIRNADRNEVLEATGPILLDEAMEYSKHPTYVLPCENFQRVPLGEYDQTLWTTVFDREVMFRLKPISKNCGIFSDDQCHFGKHHNTVSYRTTSGKVL